MILLTKTSSAGYWRGVSKRNVYCSVGEAYEVRYRSKSDPTREICAGYEAPSVNWDQGFLMTRLLNAYRRVWFSSKDLI